MSVHTCSLASACVCVRTRVGVCACMRAYRCMRAAVCARVWCLCVHVWRLPVSTCCVYVYVMCVCVSGVCLCWCCYSSLFFMCGMYMSIYLSGMVGTFRLGQMSV